MSDQKAIGISVKALSAAVANAVDREHKPGVFGPDFIIDYNLIMGRILREELALAGAVAAAGQITQHVGQAQFAGAAGAQAVQASHFQPAVLATHGRIICGFILDQRIELRE